MKQCEECNIKIKENTLLCPLCKNHLKDLDGISEELSYPIPETSPKAYTFVLRLLVFLSVLTGLLSIVTNLLIDTSFLWCAIVISTILYFWAAISNAVKKNTNLAFKILVQVIIASLLVIVIDIQTPGLGWSFTYVIPIILCSGTVAVIILVIFNRTNWARYVLYQILIAIFGFSTLLFYFTGLSKSILTTIITSFVSFGSLLATIVFADKTIKNEFKRRFHF